MQENPLVEKLQRAKQYVLLSQDQKRNIRNSLVRFIEAEKGNDQKNIFFLFTAFRRQTAFALLILVVVLLGGTVSSAAEGALPGDILYPIKININENLRGALAFSDQDKVAWETSRAERRIEEAAHLASSGKLDRARETDLGDRFEKHTDQAQTLIDKLELEGDRQSATAAALRLESSLTAQARVLRDARKQFNEQENEFGDLEERIHTRVTEAMATRVDLESVNSPAPNTIEKLKELFPEEDFKDLLDGPRLDKNPEKQDKKEGEKINGRKETGGETDMESKQE